MTSTTTAYDTTDLTVTAPAPSEARRALDGRWPLAGLVAAGTGLAFALFSSRYLGEDVTSQGPSAVYDAIKDDGLRAQIGVVTGFATVLALAVFGTGLLRFLAARAPQGSLAVPVARTGLIATVATLSVAASLKAIVRGGLPSHGDHVMYTEEAVSTLQILVDQFQYAAFWGMTLVMGATAVLALQHRVLPRWYGAVSALFTVFVLGMTGVLGLPYSSALVTPFFLVASTVVLLRTRRRLA